MPVAFPSGIACESTAADWISGAKRRISAGLSNAIPAGGAS